MNRACIKFHKGHTQTSFSPPFKNILRQPNWVWQTFHEGVWRKYICWGPIQICLLYFLSLSVICRFSLHSKKCRDLHCCFGCSFVPSFRINCTAKWQLCLAVLSIVISPRPFPIKPIKMLANFKSQTRKANWQRFCHVGMRAGASVWCQLM